MPLSPATADRLRRAGWSQDRQVDVEPVLTVITDVGLTVNDAAASFLRSFAGLSLSYPNFRDPTQPDGCHFDAARAARNVWAETIELWAERVQATLTPVGEAFNEHMTLVMAEDGTVYGGYDDFLVRVGDDGEDAIEALCTGRELHEPETPRRP